jgi:type I restriction enzyme M protein
LEEKIKLKNPRTFYRIVKVLSSVSFYDCSLDSKGAAFEYFVRATLKGKKLGQYFTPRELIQNMLVLIGRKKIINSIISGTNIKVLDPACGTGGFLVFLMQDAIDQLKQKLKKREINNITYTTSFKKIKEDTFWGSDANEGVAASAKMNMIIAGDGHTNIQHEDSLSKKSVNWSVSSPNITLILTNPPFGTSETDSLTPSDMEQFDVSSSKGQHLFIQKMIKTLVSGGEICTVIDEGVLNTESATDLRKHILTQCKLIAVVSLPIETFKPNKINVKPSLLYLEKRETPDIDFEDNYSVTVGQFTSLGYHGSGEKIRGFDKEKFLKEIGGNFLNKEMGSTREGYNWIAFNVNIQDIYKDKNNRFDFKYRNLDTRTQIKNLLSEGNINLKELNTIETSRGKSPSADSYVDELEGYALVVKAGSNINKFGEIVTTDSDWVEKSVYDEFVEKAEKEKSNLNLVKKWDVLLASTGDGTLGKCCVFDIEVPAIADGHVTIIRPDRDRISPYYLADYLRNGFGAIQVARLYTGSTGLIELTPDQADSIVVDVLDYDIDSQKDKSKNLRGIEKKYLEKMQEAKEILEESKEIMI